jgi:hypothetical protein
MSPSKVNLLNSISLIAMGIWGYFDVSSPTALIPVIFGVIILVCVFLSNKKPELNKVVAHIAVVLTLVILLSLLGMRLPKSIETGGVGLIRVLIMSATCALAVIFFVKSFVDARRN